MAELMHDLHRPVPTAPKCPISAIYVVKDRRNPNPSQITVKISNQSPQKVVPIAFPFDELAEELTPQSAQQVLAGLRELVPEPELLPAPGRSLEGKALILCGRVAEAIASSEAAYAAAGQAPKHGINLAEALLAAGQASQAAALLQPLHQQGLAVLEPDQRAALLRNFATAASQLEQPLLALQLRRQWLQLEPEAVPCDRWLGWCRVGLAQPPGDHARQEALAFLQDLRRLHPANRAIAEVLAETLEAEGDYRQAALLYRELLRP